METPSTGLMVGALPDQIDSNNSRAVYIKSDRKCPASLLFSRRIASAEHHLTARLHKTAWYIQLLGHWDEGQGTDPMPQPKDCEIPLPDLKPSDVYWRVA